MGFTVRYDIYNATPPPLHVWWLNVIYESTIITTSKHDDKGVVAV